MDMDARTRHILGSGRGTGSGARIILLGDGTEIHTGSHADDDGDVDMEDRGEAEELEEKDLEEQVRKGRGQAEGSAGKQEVNGEREETPGPSAAGEDQKVEGDSGEAVSSVEEVGPEMSPQQTRTEPKMVAPVDGADNKAIWEGKQQQQPLPESEK